MHRPLFEILKGGEVRQRAKFDLAASLWHIEELLGGDGGLSGNSATEP